MERGTVYQLREQPHLAYNDLDGAVRLAPDAVSPWILRANLHAMEGHPRDAVADYERALSIEPTNVGVLNIAAWIRATCPDEEFRSGAEAMAYAAKVCDLCEPIPIDYRDTLAAACAEVGDFGEAIMLIEELLDECDPVPPEYLARLELYRQRTPCRCEVSSDQQMAKLPTVAIEL